MILPVFAVIRQSLALKKFEDIKRASACNFETLHRSVKNSEHNGQLILNKTPRARCRKMMQIKKEEMAAQIF